MTSLCKSSLLNISYIITVPVPTQQRGAGGSGIVEVENPLKAAT